MIRKVFLLFISTCQIIMADVEMSGHVDLNSQAYLIKPDSKDSSSFTATQTLELNYTKDDLSAYAKLYAQEAKNDRTFARVDELFLKYDFEDDSIQAGKSVKFWGALELRNIVDGFNPQELRNDMFKTDKLGVYNASYSHYTDSGEIEVIVKLYEQDQKMAGFPYVYYVFSKNINYDDNLNTSKSEYRPSIYLKYSGSTDSEYPLDFAFIYENGYDSQRYFSKVQNQANTYLQNTYIVNKFMTYNTLVVGSTLIKLEALYAVVEDEVNVGDYAHLACGFEHSLEDFKNGATLGIIGEYYRYFTFENDKYNDLQLFETMQNDLFIGARYSFNNADDSSFVGGGIFDTQYNEQTYYAKFESRFGNDYKVELDYYYIEPSKNTLTANALLGRHQRVGLNVAYYF